MMKIFEGLRLDGRNEISTQVDRIHLLYGGRIKMTETV